MKTTKLIMSFACAAALCGGAFAQEAEKPSEEESAPHGWSHAMGDGLKYNGNSILLFETSLGVDSRYMTYGLIDGKDPIFRPNITMTMADWVYFTAEGLFDLTKGNGKRGGYGNRAGKCQTLDTSVGLYHEFEINEDVGTLSVDFSYMYEYLPRHHGLMRDTQYFDLVVGLSEGSHWIAPKLWIERDIMIDEGTYVNLELGHKFALVQGEEGEDPVVAFTPSVAQGVGNTSRTHGYFGGHFRHGGMMDTCLKGTLRWNIASGVALEGYVAYTDYIFDSNMRDAARAYNAEWGKGCDHSWNFFGGIALKLTF